MGLRDAIPGLKTHDTVISSVPPVTPVVVSFDAESAYAVIRNAIQEIGTAFPAGDAWGWLIANRPDVVSALKQAGNDMNVAFLEQSAEKVTACADRFIRMHKKAFRLFEERPPVIERQDDLFMEAA